MEHIQLSTLGLNVNLGDFYNHHTGRIFSSAIKQESPIVRKDCEIKPEKYFLLFHQLDLFNRGVLANRLRHKSIDSEGASVDCDRLQKFVDSVSIQTEGEDDAVQVFLFIRITKRTETLPADSELTFQYQLESNGRATHLVEEIVYGAELICSITKCVDGRSETKNDVVNGICRSAKEFINKITEPELTDINLPLELDKTKIRFEILSENQTSQQMDSFEKLRNWLKNAVNNGNDDNWRPIKINLRKISDQLEARLWIEKKTYTAFVKKEWETKLENDSEFSKIRNNLSYDQTELLWAKVLNFDEKLFNKNLTPKNVLAEMRPTFDLLEDLPRWLLSGTSDVEEVQSLYDRIQDLIGNKKEEVVQQESNNLLVNEEIRPRQLKETEGIFEHQEKSIYSTQKRSKSVDLAYLSFSNQDDENEMGEWEITENKLDVNASDTEKTDDSSEIPEDSNQRISEILIREVYSEFIESNVYLLKAKEHSDSDDLRWFEIGRPARKLKLDHKVIVLMGATGSGKSTLINGMVNYILGVKWNDPFRFKCVREDESASRNQALSQTSSVTAYTIHHREGMTVPYSITLIDTPGYGDTRGVKRDKEITQLIHRFLMEKDVAIIDEIHAACFVAASGDSRLTVTQRYIIDSVLSIFGKDFKDNIRLLVTFADNADPPVVDACLAAHFPTTSAGISYSKFNSSVLYASNKQMDEEDYGFDELFWDMGQENFAKFFTMLERMDGKNLKSTREVIQHRLNLEESLKEIERELEVCFIKIENMDMFIGKLTQYGHAMKNNRNLVVEKTEMMPTFMCRHCNKIRRDTTRNSTAGDVQPQEGDTICKCPPKSPAYKNFSVQNIPVKVETTLGKMKSEFELIYKEKLKSEELLAKCMEDLNQTKANVIRLFEQVGTTGRSLDSTALRSNALSPADYLSLMRSRVAEKQAPGYLTRLETLAELQQIFTAQEEFTCPTIASVCTEENFISGLFSTSPNDGTWFAFCLTILRTCAPICDDALKFVLGSELCDIFYENVESLMNLGQFPLLLVRGDNRSERNAEEGTIHFDKWDNANNEDNEYFAYSMRRVD